MLACPHDFSPQMGMMYMLFPQSCCYFKVYSHDFHPPIGMARRVWRESSLTAQCWQERCNGSCLNRNLKVRCGGRVPQLRNLGEESVARESLDHTTLARGVTEDCLDHVTLSSVAGESLDRIT